MPTTEALAPPSPDATVPDRPTVAIAGASGFVGTALRRALADDYDLVGLTRSPNRAARKDADDPIVWRHCDLYSLREVEQGLEGADLAIYLVHSMLPSSRLTQGTFADLDLILADNGIETIEGAAASVEMAYFGWLRWAQGVDDIGTLSDAEVRRLLAPPYRSFLTDDVV